jgi:hypothetical protein
VSLSDLASLGSFVSAVAVLVSLVYLSIQVRQAEKNQRSLMQQGRADRASSSALRMAEKDMISVYANGLAGDENFSAEDVQRFLVIARAMIVSAEDAFLHHKMGQMDDGSWRGVQSALRAWAASPGLRAAWRLTSNMYSAEFANFMDDVFRETHLAPESDARAKWIEAVRKEKSDG